MASKKNSTATTEQLPSGIVFRQPHAGAPAALVADVEVPIHRGPLAGLKVTGVTIWRRHADGELFVRFPSRPEPIPMLTTTCSWSQPSSATASSA